MSDTIILSKCSAIIVLSGSNSRDSASVCEGSDPEEVHRHIEMIHAVWKK